MSRKQVSFEPSERYLKQPNVGDAIVYVTPEGTPVHALVKCVWPGEGPGVIKYDDGSEQEHKEKAPMVNIVFVSTDENRQDPCGRQTEIETSIYHVSMASAHGNYWRFAEEADREYVAPNS